MTTPRRRSSRPADAPLRAIGYRRVSTGEQVESGAGLDAQLVALKAESARQGFVLEVVTDAGLSAATLDRPALAEALARLDRGDAEVLIASKLDRVSRSVRDFAGLLERAQRHGWRLVLLDLGDTSTPAGEMTANIIASAAQYERRLIGQRTREGLAAKRAAGVRLGRPSVLPAEVVRRVVDERAGGAILREIAAGLTADGVPTARGGAVWSTSSVQAVLAGQDAALLNGPRSTRQGASAAR